LKDGICDECSSNLIKREDDNEETFNKRYDIYVNETYPLVDFFKQKGMLSTIEGEFTKEETFDKIKEIIND